MPHKDLEKRRAYHRKWSANNPEWWEQRRERNKQLVREAKNQPCADCGRSYPYYVMDLDHREDKKFVLAIVAKKHWAVERIQEEIAKCDVVCSNCHRERTAKRANYWI